MEKTQAEKNREYQKRYKEKPGVKEKYRELNKAWIEKNRTQYNSAKSQYRYKLKVAAIHHYSNGTMACTYCGYNTDLDAMCLDHINDDGAEQRKALNCSSRGGINGTTIYERLKALGWIDGLQVLCFNCNTIKELRRKRGGKTSHEMLEIVSLPTRWANSE